MTPTHRYSIHPTDPAAHLYEMRLVVADPDPAGQVFTLPAWIPGSYMIRDYARHVVSARAESDGLAVALEKIDKSSWRAAPVERELTLVFEIYAHDESVRGAHLDLTHAFFNGTCVFPAVAGQESQACELEILPPEKPVGKNWRVATSMRRKNAQEYGFGTYEAADYAELIDQPVEIGELSIGEFEAGGIPHAIAIRGNTRVDMARLCHDLQTICEQHMSLLEPPADLDRYLFLLNAPGSGYGGLEHRWSSANICARDNLPARGDEDVSDEYRTFLGLVSHEYFHLWNVKRMKPAAFSPYDLSREVHTELLWVFEGITSYYDDLALVRSGLIDTESYLELLGQTMTRVARGGGRRRQSVAESSFDAWTKFYKQDANAANSIVSYYAKGALIALALDLKMRSETHGQASLDDVMRAAWQRWGESPEGMPEDGLESLCAEVSGLDLDSFLDAAVRGTGELPLETLLRTHGIEMHERRATGGKDKGGKAAADGTAPEAWLGAGLGARAGKAVFTVVHNHGPAERAGIAPGDELVALDGLRIEAAGADDRARRYKPGDRSDVTVFRGDELMSLRLRWAEAPADTCYLLADDEADEAAAARRMAWLGH
ncbi:MAG: PDZ domain-containing protein [Gammaproteobacteria bacterium]|nr:PDZ domain-containing protein [Gammaproteobacteria bacterium]MBT8105988.1 PDZ domain-containing protein [Gammaproteobacteria bacterium]NNF48357.1 M61 family metallopeptidase [Woeseiaceae bacterium]NNK26002.1 M61 family metallopeptidase [Woeseiaceae bacterium]NNL63926.1 M61 family metallopeptidase [Woeseiaceae bacterium]